MKKLLLSALMLTSLSANSQTILFQDDFESGGANWSLNIGGTGNNTWVVNNAFDSVVFTPTPAQPAAITNAPNSTYLHIHSDIMCQSVGECQAIFLAANGGDYTAEIANSISTLGATSVTFNFYYLCMGMSGTTYGAVDYSLDNGATWSNVATNYSGIGNWTSESLTNAAWDNQAQLKFRFHWIEGITGVDPAFAVDQVSITGVQPIGMTSITTGTVIPSSWCYGTTITGTLNFDANGTYGTANVYTAEMSDATGSFAAPTSIGTLTSSASGPLSINITIPGSMPAGTGYRIRVVASMPGTTGTDNGSDIIIYALPTVTLGAYSDVCIYTPGFTLTGGTPTGGTYSGPGVAAGAFDPAAAGLGTHTISYSYTDGNGCSASASETILVDACAALSEQENDGFRVYPNPANGSFVISFEGTIDRVCLMDLSGRTIKTYGEKLQEYEIKDVPAGMYVLEILSDKKTRTTRLLIE